MAILRWLAVVIQLTPVLTETKCYLEKLLSLEELQGCQSHLADSRVENTYWLC